MASYASSSAASAGATADLDELQDNNAYDAHARLLVDDEESLSSHAAATRRKPSLLGGLSAPAANNNLFKFVLTLANSIIGVSILAMPFCFKQCGVVLATLMLLLSGALVKLTCHLLLKASVLARRRNYELLGEIIFAS